MVHFGYMNQTGVFFVMTSVGWSFAKNDVKMQCHNTDVKCHEIYVG